MTLALPLTEEGLIELIASDRWMMRALRSVAQEGLPDWWIVAGFVRTKVWDTLHGFKKRTPLADVDVVFFARSLPADTDRRIERRLRESAPAYPWEVFNQAHMHTYNGDSPYESSVDAFSRWAETVSTIGVSLDNKSRRPVVAAPHGLEDLGDMVVRPTPHRDAKRDIFKRRLAEKKWQEHWPQVRIEGI